MTDPINKHASSRLCFRREGGVIKIYVAEPDTMDGAFEVGQVSVHFAQQPGWFDDFVALMAKAHATFITQATGATVISQEMHAAPEHERGGHA